MTLRKEMEVHVSEPVLCSNCVRDIQIFWIVELMSSPVVASTFSIQVECSRMLISRLSVHSARIRRVMMSVGRSIRGCRMLDAPCR